MQLINSEFGILRQVIPCETATPDYLPQGNRRGNWEWSDDWKGGYIKRKKKLMEKRCVDVNGRKGMARRGGL